MFYSKFQGTLKQVIVLLQKGKESLSDMGNKTTNEIFISTVAGDC